MMRHRNQIRWLRRWRSSDFKEKDSKTVTSNKNSKASEEDWLGELLVGAVKLAGLGVFRFALRWPDTATLLLVFALTGVLGGLRWACVLAGLGAGGVWGWRLGWPDS
jgi:S-DNA-T family DNA segregation ATPase FtsK/SpoIIIE